MKKVYIFIAALFSVVSSTAQHHAKDKPSVHGMLVFGKEKIYASHLPMFHSPHNYQVILELKLAEKDKEAFITDQKAYPETATYTLAPEQFVLPDILLHPKPFKAMLYRGHFERGGAAITDSVSVTIEQVIYNTRFDGAASQIPTANYILFGNEKEQFAAHRISSAPDFDHVLQVKLVTPFLAKPIEVIVNHKSNTVPGTGGNLLQAKTIRGEPISFTWLRQLYLEFDDLK